jgi:hypothetical protein
MLSALTWKKQVPRSTTAIVPAAGACGTLAASQASPT